RASARSAPRAGRGSSRGRRRPPERPGSRTAPRRRAGRGWSRPGRRWRGRGASLLLAPQTHDPGAAEAVVVLLVIAEPHRVRRGLHVGEQRNQQLLLGPDEALAVVVGDLVLVGQRQRAGRARLDAQAAEDAAQVVDLVDVAVPLARGEALLVG